MSANQQVLAGLGGGVPVDQYLFTTPTDDNAWVVPAGVTSISVVCVGHGATSNSSTTGSGGCLRYVNNIPVTPGETLRIDVRDSGARLRRGATVLCYGPNYVDRALAVGIGGNGGVRGNAVNASTDFGCGGAGGYSGPGGNGGTAGGANPTAGTGGGGGGGGAHLGGGTGAGGGGVSVYGIGANGAAGVNDINPAGGGGGSGGASGGANGVPGSYGGGGNSYNGAVRIIWPGNLRQFPSTRTANE